MAVDPLALIPLDKFDKSKANELISLGYPAVAEAIPQMLEWVQDGNWPVAHVFLPFLSSIGTPLAPHIRVILKSNDETWKWFVLQNIVAASNELADNLRTELKRLAESPTSSEIDEELDILSKEILAELRT